MSYRSLASDLSNRAISCRYCGCVAAAAAVSLSIWGIPKLGVAMYKGVL